MWYWYFWEADHHHLTQEFVDHCLLVLWVGTLSDTLFSEICNGNQPPDTLNYNMLINAAFFGYLLFLFNDSQPLQINHLHLNPCFVIWFLGKPNWHLSLLQTPFTPWMEGAPCSPQHSTRRKALSPGCAVVNVYAFRESKFEALSLAYSLKHRTKNSLQLPLKPSQARLLHYSFFLTQWIWLSV